MALGQSRTDKRVDTFGAVYIPYGSQTEQDKLHFKPVRQVRCQADTRVPQRETSCAHGSVSWGHHMTCREITAVSKEQCHLLITLLLLLLLLFFFFFFSSSSSSSSSSPPPPSSSPPPPPPPPSSSSSSSSSSRYNNKYVRLQDAHPKRQKVFQNTVFQIHVITYLSAT